MVVLKNEKHIDKFSYPIENSYICMPLKNE